MRGALERTYVLRLSAARINPDEVAAMTADEHRQTFLAFVAGLLGDFDRYISQEGADPLRDRVSFNAAAVWLDDTEFLDLLRDLARVLQPRGANPPGPGRKRRMLTTVLLPGGVPPGQG